MWSTLVPLCAIAAIFSLETIALRRGINGRVLTLSVACIAGLGGFGVSELINIIGG